ncbi:MAG: NAD-dependent dehydratase [Candidatus Zixiibacteriota bacterium]|nr:MAG: NAD-dependent dehydratase [candidate division Zixibacteria bacterium]
MSLKNKPVAVTGADGFIGSHLCEELVRRGCRVRALAMYNSFGHSGWLDRFHPDIQDKLEIVAGDVRDPHQMVRFLEGREIVFHLASLIAIPFSYHSPDSYVDTNVKGTLNLLQAARTTGLKIFVHTSTSEIYGSAQYTPIDEKHPVSAQSPYAASKVAADQLAMSFHRSFDLPVITVRPFNTFGPRQSARAIIPTIITQLAAGNDTVKLGSLTPTRDFTFVSDIVKGFVAAAECKDAIGETINLGTGSETSINELVRLIAVLMNQHVTITKDEQRVRPEKSEVDRLVCDASKAENLFDWKPTVTLDEGLKKTIEWFSDNENLALYKPNRYNI